MKAIRTRKLPLLIKTPLGMLNLTFTAASMASLSGVIQVHGWRVKVTTGVRKTDDGWILTGPMSLENFEPGHIAQTTHMLEGAFRRYAAKHPKLFRFIELDFSTQKQKHK